jgi:hypothetical protein
MSESPGRGQERQNFALKALNLDFESFETQRL